MVGLNISKADEVEREEGKHLRDDGLEELKEPSDCEDGPAVKKVKRDLTLEEYEAMLEAEDLGGGGFIEDG